MRKVASDQEFANCPNCGKDFATILAENKKFIVDQEAFENKTKADAQVDSSSSGNKLAIAVKNVLEKSIVPAFKDEPAVWAANKSSLGNAPNDIIDDLNAHYESLSNSSEKTKFLDKFRNGKNCARSHEQVIIALAKVMDDDVY